MTEPGDKGAPLDLGVVGEQPATDPQPERLSPRRTGRWRWTIVAAAFAAGGVLALVVDDARDRTAAYADVRVVGGAIHGMSDQADESAPGFIELSLLNMGEHEVEILGLELPGLTVSSDEEPAEPLAAPPGEWVIAEQRGLIADCDAAPSTTLRVHVRDAGGTERVVEASGLPQFGGIDGLQSHVCRPADLVFPATGPSIVASAPDSLTMQLRVSNDGSEPLSVSVFEPDAPGMIATGPELPLEVPADGSVFIPLTWTVTDCRLAAVWPGVQIAYAAGDDAQLRGHYQIDGVARAELVLLVDRVCG